MLQDRATLRRSLRLDVGRYDDRRHAHAEAREIARTDALGDVLSGIFCDQIVRVVAVGADVG